MSTGPWTPYNKAKAHLCDGVFDLDSNAFRMSLYTSASNAASVTLSTIGSVVSEVITGFGYSAGGRAIAGVTWGTGSSARQQRFTCGPTSWTAVAGSIDRVKFAVVSQAGGALLCYAQLSTAQFSVPSGHAITIAPAISIFDLS